MSWISQASGSCNLEGFDIADTLAAKQLFEG
jgi:hypothetical protein